MPTPREVVHAVHERTGVPSPECTICMDMEVRSTRKILAMVLLKVGGRVEIEEKFMMEHFDAPVSVRQWRDEKTGTMYISCKKKSDEAPPDSVGGGTVGKGG